MANLFEDPGLRLGTPDFAAWARFLQFRDIGGTGKTFRIEEGRKLLVAGAIGECGSKHMCGQKLARSFPLPRATDVIMAFVTVNKPLFADIFARARAQLRRMGEGLTTHVNIKQFLEEPFERMLFTSGELHVAEPGDRERGFWEEACHKDGAGSLLHLSLTVFGRRDVRCEQSSDASDSAGLSDVLISCRPGTLYFGAMTGPKHQVRHTEAAPHELWKDPRREEERSTAVTGGPGVYAVTIQARTGLFAHCRAHQRDTSPAPWEGFKVIVENIRQGIARMPFRLPTMEQVDSEAAKRPRGRRVSSDEAAGPPKRAKKGGA